MPARSAGTPFTGASSPPARLVRTVSAARSVLQPGVLPTAPPVQVTSRRLSLLLPTPTGDEDARVRNHRHRRDDRHHLRRAARAGPGLAATATSARLR